MTVSSSDCYSCTQVSTHLFYDAFIVCDVLAEVHGWIPHVVLTVQTAAGLLQVLVFGDGNLIPRGRNANTIRTTVIPEEQTSVFLHIRVIVVNTTSFLFIE